MDAGASEKKQKVCKDVNKSAREDIYCEAGLCLEHRWHQRDFEKYTTSVQPPGAADLEGVHVR